MSDDSVPLEDSNWNVFLRAGSIFCEEINAIQTKTFNKTAILTELKNLLLQDCVLETLFSRFLVEFEVESENSEERRQIFAKNLLEIAEHNICALNGLQTWFQGVNRFTYMSNAEFLTELRLSYPPAKKRKLEKICMRFRSCFRCSCIPQRRCIK